MNTHRVLIRSSVGHVVLETTDSNIAEMVRGSEFLRRYIPDYAISNSELNFVGCPKLLVDKGDRTFEMSYPSAIYRNDTIAEKDVVSVLEMLLERDRQEHGVHCIHSSAAEVSGKGVIFWGGASGMGKTTLALLLGGANASSVYSDEKTLINPETMEMVGGVRTAYITKGEVVETHGLGYKDLNNVGGPGLPLALLVQPQVIPGADLLVDEWSSEKTDWHMYEELTRKIRGTSRRLFNNAWPVQSIDTDELAKKRSSDSAKISKCVKSYFMRGDAVAIRDAILKTLS